VGPLVSSRGVPSEWVSPKTSDMHVYPSFTVGLAVASISIEIGSRISKCESTDDKGIQ
jgi:hypothetical protein